jgi:hypothetical protein
MITPQLFQLFVCKNNTFEFVKRSLTNPNLFDFGWIVAN